MLLLFLHKNRFDFCLFFVCIVSDFEYFQNLEGVLTLRRHTETDGFILVSIKEGTHDSYTLVANIRVWGV